MCASSTNLVVSHNSSADMPQQGCSSTVPHTHIFLSKICWRKNICAHTSRSSNPSAWCLDNLKAWKCVYIPDEIGRLQAVVLEQWGQGAFGGGKCLWDEVRWDPVFIMWPVSKVIIYQGHCSVCPERHGQAGHHPHCVFHPTWGRGEWQWGGRIVEGNRRNRKTPP